jgi:hypothetical protein
MQVTNPGYFLAGWYTTRTPIDPENPDAGYVYSGKWDFESNKLRIDPSFDYSADVPALTLYAAWVPYYNFEIYTTDENGNSYLLSTVSALNLTIPKWHDGDVTLNMDNFPTRDGYTLIPDEIEYLDSNVVETVTDKKTAISGKWDEAIATSITPTIRINTKWKEGKTYRIDSTADRTKNADLNGYYEIYCDLDVTGVEWPSTFLNGKFNGKIYGNSHKISGVSFESNSRNRTSNGLFSSLGESAYIENLTFENITHTVDLAEVVQGMDTTFGLLAGAAPDGASFKNVKIGGSLIFGDNCAELVGKSGLTIKKIIGSGSISGITELEITVAKKNADNAAFNLVTEADGSISIVPGT